MRQLFAVEETHGGRVFNVRDLIQVKRDKEFDLVPILQDSQEALLFCLIHDDQLFCKASEDCKAYARRMFCTFAYCAGFAAKKSWPVAGMKPDGNFQPLFIVDSLAFSLILYCL
ncbi:MAG: hypothetical protein RSF79_12650 [Janthinobacterium sp.]